ncbi:MAG: N-acetyl-gamma-glutamyl-phosphate reductase [Planctomycetota bacterium]
MSVPVAVVGITGYTGRELARLLSFHPELDLVAVFASERVEQIASLGDKVPELRGLLDLPVQAVSVGGVLACAPRVVFLATPHEASATLAGQLIEADDEVVVVDLSGSFRLRDRSVFEQAYGFANPFAGLADSAAYGLPELDRSGLSNAKLIACAGCYVTAASVPLGSISEAGLLESTTVPIIDATSGVSGAGRAAKSNTAFCEVSQSPYGVFSHRHRPEIEQAVGRRVIFQPHLGPYDRGILATIHAQLAPGVTASDVAAAFEASLGSEPFVRLLGDVTRVGRLPTVRDVRRTNFVDIAFAVEGSHLILFSALDNLMKGASGQAVQCANAALGLAETAGLLPASNALPAENQA